MATSTMTDEPTAATERQVAVDAVLDDARLAAQAALLLGGEAVQVPRRFAVVAGVTGAVWVLLRELGASGHGAPIGYERAPQGSSRSARRGP